MKDEMQFVIALTVITAVVAGGFYAWSAAIAAVCLLAFLTVVTQRAGVLKLRLNYTGSALLLILLGYAISVFWAADRGMAGYGFVKFLPVVLYALLLMQLDSTQIRRILLIVPWVGAVMTAVSFPMQYVPVLSKYVFINHRLAGTFQYANTYALYLLIGCVVLLEEKPKRRNLLLGTILLIGIFASGSRTTVILLGAVLVVFCIHSKNRRYLFALAGMIGLGTVTAVVLAMMGIVDSARFLTTLSTPTTLLERLLYFKDALPLILTHPLGTGYLGYCAMQSGIQTGIYSTRFVHNELLQMLLDVGWLPTGVFVSAMIRSLFQKESDALSRTVLLIIVAHAMMDFDLQFLSIWFLLIPAMGVSRGREFQVKRLLKPAMAQSWALVLLCIWMGVGDCLASFSLSDLCLRVTPMYTEAWQRKLESASTVEELEYTANHVLSLNDYSAIAHNAKGDAAYSKGDMMTFIEEKERAVSLAPYYPEYYCDYFDKVWTAMEQYRSMGDEQSALVCRDILLSIPIRLEETAEKTDPIAWQLKHRPELELPEEYMQRLHLIGG